MVLEVLVLRVQKVLRVQHHMEGMEQEYMPVGFIHLDNLMVDVMLVMLVIVVTQVTQVIVETVHPVGEVNISQDQL